MAAVLAIDIGGTRMKAGLFERSPVALRTGAVATPLTASGFHAALAGLVREVTGGERVAAVGIACKGIVHPETTRIEVLPGTLRFLEGTVLGDLVAKAVGYRVPAIADNDARAAMAGEMEWGAARGLRNALMLTLGTGVGGAILAEGRLVRGTSGVGSHLGHTTVDPDGPPCICGNHGCLEVFFSARAIESEAMAAVRRGVDSVLKDRFLETPERLTCQDVFDAAAAGDRVAGWVTGRAIHYLAGAVGGMLHMFDPEVVIVGGQIAEAGEALFEPLRAEVWRRSEAMLRRRVPVAPAQVSGSTGLAGAAALAWQI